MIAFNVLVLGDKAMASRFKKYAKLGLAKKYKNRRIVVYTDSEGAIADQPYDVVLLALDLDSLQTTNNPLPEIWEAERRAVEHFGEIIYR